MDSSFCVDALEHAIHCYGKPKIYNTDQGSQYTSEAFTDALKDNDIDISMDGKGAWRDNVFVERLSVVRNIRRFISMCINLQPMPGNH